MTCQINYSYIAFRAPVQCPTSAFRGSRREVFQAQDSNGNKVICIRREGNVVTLHDPKSNRCIEVPWSQVRFAELCSRVELPADKIKKAV